MVKNGLPLKTEILIIGAGPAGSTLAYQLARWGIDVVLLDKAKFPRGKTCGGGINVRAQKLIPFDISPVVEQVITGISFTRNFEEHFRRQSSEPLMVTVIRENFDHFLVKQAQQAGVRFYDETALLSLAPGDSSIEVETSGGLCSAKYLVGADGAQSPVAKKLGLMQEASYMLAMHSEVPTSLLPHWEQEVIHIDWGSLRRTYAYLFPKKNFLSVGAGGINIPTMKIKNYHRAFLATQWRKEEALPFSTAGFMVPLRQKRSPIQEHRCLLLGDAAGLADPFCGEGIFYAIRSAQIAAPVLQEALKNDSNSLKPYQEAVDGELMPELECSRLFRGLFNLRPSFFHRKIAENDRWWNTLTKIIRGEKTFLDIKKKLRLLGSVLLRMAR